jgi:hypothetical protein
VVGPEPVIAEVVEPKTKPKIQLKKKPIKKKPIKKKPIKKTQEPESDYDSDIEADIKKMLIKEKTDQDANKPEEMKSWRNKIYNLWKIEIIDTLTDSCSNDITSDDIIDNYVERTKRQRGTKADIGLWAMRNPVSVKKIITSILKKIQKQFDKDYE